MKSTKFSSIFSTFIFCYLFWILFTWTFTSQELITGAVVSFLVAVLTARFFIHQNAFHLFNPVRFFNLVLYIFVFLKELWKANVDVAKRALNPNLPINPGIVKVPVGLESEYGMSMLANSITLTPGTITMDITEENGKNYFYIHWIDVAEKDREKAGDAIKGTLENWIRRIWK
ncbi:Na+/H+ antiporter subunit E [Caloramator proteoclasticus]|uniref:Multicomponent Na+:H+ antiporter subunit E n=1 Tax=Caloramator proteoclasticus DSM 10124 TaxID=1121262 RepID=A0A1M4TE87_9CLOT|nr:Na+/H+ antiporter subunit E [Caloramator proteoclasticus]SHE42812.1 multicomponent Na+:H+ antiporter subunit E [Caloramator proteoclasticus DSM 10124]